MKIRSSLCATFVIAMTGVFACSSASNNGSGDDNGGGGAGGSTNEGGSSAGGHAQNGGSSGHGGEQAGGAAGSSAGAGGGGGNGGSSETGGHAGANAPSGGAGGSSSIGGSSGGAGGGAGGATAMGGSGGATEHADAGGPVLSYAKDIAPIIANKCKDCHTTGMDGGLKSTYATLVTMGNVSADHQNCGYLDATKKRVVPGKPDVSLMYIKISHTQADLAAMNCGGPMPKTGMLTTTEKQTIHDWIAQGANP